MGETVLTPYGRLTGTEEEGVHVFRGVPFAQPPVGTLRFRSPQRLQPWRGERRADQSGPASWQVNTQNQDKVQRLVEQLGTFPGIRNSPPFSSVTYYQPAVSEDCLFLDIWTPSMVQGAKLPVYVYYHGGANAGSAGSATLERGARLAREENIVVVRPSYRLGALGWVHFGLIGKEFPEAVNLGVQDQLGALQWVSECIAAFGGDPDNVTVGGESAGATAVSHLLTNPVAWPLFKRAVIQSLSPFNQWCTQHRQDAVAVAELYLHMLGIGGAADLKVIDPDRLLAVNLALLRFFDADLNCAWRPLGAVVDGRHVPEQPATLLAEGTVRPGLDLMIGFAKDEWQFFRGHAPTLQHGTREQVLAVLAPVFGDHANGLLDDYAAIYPGRPVHHLLGDIMSFEFFKYSSLRIAANVAGQGGQARVFQFSFDLPGRGGYLRAVHTGDMPFIWRNTLEADMKRWPAFEGVDRAAVDRSARMFGRFYGAFIRGEPIGPDWPVFDPERQCVLWFGSDVEPRDELLSREMAAFQSASVGNVADLDARLSVACRAALSAR